VFLRIRVFNVFDVFEKYIETRSNVYDDSDSCWFNRVPPNMRPLCIFT
jgi:hypothetical protein